MIVQCEQCRTKFRLDDGKVSDRGVKVRCAKCRHVFTVRKPEIALQSAAMPESVAATAEMPAVDDVWAPALEAADATVRMTTAPAPEPVQEDDLREPGMVFDFGAPPLDSAVSAADAFDPGQTDAAAGGDVDFADLSFTAESAAIPAAVSDVGEMTMVMPPQKQDTDISAVFATAPPVAEDNFNLGDIDFGTGTPAAPERQPDAVAETPTPEAAVPSAPPVPDISFDAPELKEEQQEAPPLSISSRHRQSPLLSILVTILGVLVLGVAGFTVYNHLSDDPGAFKLFEKPRVPVEEGRITVRKISATYLEQAVAGELLVISGEAVNNFTKTRAALQLKGMVFGGDGGVLISKVAYAGNTLTHEQLLTMPLDKIEAAMNNQFGDSLINLEVQPGKAIPFIIVIVNPPKEGREFGVEAAGSTVAASK